MGAKLEIADGTMTVDPSIVMKSDPKDVWLEYTMTNVGDEDGAMTNYYVTVDDGGSEYLYSEFVGDDAVAVGEMVKHSLRIEASTFADKFGSYWVSLRNESGETIAAVAIDVGMGP